MLCNLIRKDQSTVCRQLHQALKSLYIWLSNDWTGRGAIGNAGLDASVAAHEAVLAELETAKGEGEHERET